MKGQTTINVNGEEVDLKFTLGISEDMQEYAEENDVDPDTDPKAQRVMFALMELYATEEEWQDPNILDKAEEEALKYKALGLDQISTLTDMIEEATEGLDVGNMPKGKEKS